MTDPSRTSCATTTPRPAARGTRAVRAVGAAAALALLAAGCGDDVTAGPASSSPVAASSPVSDAPAPTTTVGPTTDGPTAGGTTDAPVPTASPAPTSGDEAGAADPAAADVGTAPSEEAATGAGLSITEVRTGRHEGFDRVVVELAGDPAGLPGWYAHYVDEPAQQGSGDPVAVEGERSLEVVVRGLGYPFDTGEDELLGSVDGQGTALVRQVVVGGVFEGQAQVVVGLDAAADAPYRVTRLSDPPRVVVDVLG